MGLRFRKIKANGIRYIGVLLKDSSDLQRQGLPNVEHLGTPGLTYIRKMNI